MKLNKLVVLSLVGMTAFASCQPQGGKKETFNGKLNSNIDSVSYALGVQYGNFFKQNQLTNEDFDSFNMAAMSAGMADVLDTSKAELISMEVMNPLMQGYFEKIRGRAFESIKAENAKFLEDNAKREGVMTTGSGLQYEVITEGTGDKPTADKTVKVHYTGKLIDGTTFDSSVDRGEPIEFPLGGVIPGWTEGLQLMSVGSKYKLYIPYNLGYGERGAGAMIKPYSTLVFEVELLEIK